MDMNSFRPRYNFCLVKAWFEKGYGITHWFKYLVVLFGWASGDVTTTAYIIAIYVLLCFVMGFFWYKYMQEAENEVANRYNLFVKEMRKKMK